MTENIIYVQEGLGYFKSSLVKMYPSAFRGNDSNGNPLDVESSLNTEANITSISSVKDFSNTYIANYDTASLELVLAGYRFKISMPDQNKSLIEGIKQSVGTNNIWVKIKLADKNILNNTATKILANWYKASGVASDTLDSLIDNAGTSDYYFTGLAICTEDKVEPESICLKLIDADGNYNQEKLLPANINHGSAQDSLTIGNGLIANTENQTVIGTFNAVNGEALFAVGNGTSNESRHNAFTVTKNNSAIVENIKTSNITANVVGGGITIDGDIVVNKKVSADTLEVKDNIKVNTAGGITVGDNITLNGAAGDINCLDIAAKNIKTDALEVKENITAGKSIAIGNNITLNGAEGNVNCKNIMTADMMATGSAEISSLEVKDNIKLSSTPVDWVEEFRLNYNESGQAIPVVEKFDDTFIGQVKLTSEQTGKEIIKPLFRYIPAAESSLPDLYIFSICQIYSGLSFFANEIYYKKYLKEITPGYYELLKTAKPIGLGDIDSEYTPKITNRSLFKTELNTNGGNFSELLSTPLIHCDRILGLSFNNLPPQLGTEPIGTDKSLVYLANGVITESKATVGTKNSLVYLNNGTITESDEYVGSETEPIYLKGGKFEPCTAVPAAESLKCSKISTFVGNIKNGIKFLDNSILAVNSNTHQAILTVNAEINASTSQASTWGGLSSNRVLFTLPYSEIASLNLYKFLGSKAICTALVSAKYQNIGSAVVAGPFCTLYIQKDSINSDYQLIADFGVNIYQGTIDIQGELVLQGFPE